MGLWGERRNAFTATGFTSVTQPGVNKLLQVLDGCGGRGGNVLNNTLYHYNEHLKLAEIADKI